MQYCSRARRSVFTSSAIWSSRSAAGVPGRGEYLNENAPAKPTSSTMRKVSLKSSSVSLGKPTMKSDVKAISGRTARNRAMASRYSALELRHQNRQAAMCTDQIVVHVAGMAGRVAKPQQPWYVGETMQQVGERRRPAVRSLAVIGVDVLSDEGDLANASSHQVFRLRHNRLDRSRQLGAARIRHHTERAELVAALLYRHERGDAAGARCPRCRRHQMSKLVFDGEFGVDHLGATPDPRQQRREPMVILRPDHQVDHRRAAHDLFAFGLRDASRDRNKKVAAGTRGLMPELADPAKFRIDLLGSFFPDVTGIEDDEIGILGGGGFDIRIACQKINHTMRIVDVHLTAVGFNVELRQALGIPYNFAKRSAIYRQSHS